MGPLRSFFDLSRSFLPFPFLFLPVSFLPFPFRRLPPEDELELELEEDEEPELELGSESSPDGSVSDSELFSFFRCAFDLLLFFFRSFLLRSFEFLFRFSFFFYFSSEELEFESSLEDPRPELRRPT